MNQLKRHSYGRKRRKRFLWFKNRGLLATYFNRFKKPKVIETKQEITPKVAEIKSNKTMLSGYKTYISGGLIVLFAALYALNLIEGETFLKLFGIFVGTGFVAGRIAITKCEK